MSNFEAFNIYLAETFNYPIKLRLHNLQLTLYKQYKAALLLEKKDLFLYLIIY